MEDPSNFQAVSTALKFLDKSENINNETLAKIKTLLKEKYDAIINTPKD